MKSRSDFAKALAKQDESSHLSRAIALLWYYRQSQEYEERSASELAADLHTEGFPKPNVSKLSEALRKSGFTIKGKRPGTFQLDVRRLPQLDEMYDVLLARMHAVVSDLIIPSETVAGTRVYLERLVHQINGTYEYGFFDACAVLCRRIMESLLIEIYVHHKRQDDIRINGAFVSLEKLIAKVKADYNSSFGRSSFKTMDEVKHHGDSAAHDRLYITNQVDIDDFKVRYRKLMSELLILAGVRK